MVSLKSIPLSARIAAGFTLLLVLLTEGMLLVATRQAYDSYHNFALDEAESVGRALRSVAAFHWQHPDEVKAMTDAFAEAQTTIFIGPAIAPERRGRDLSVVDREKRVVAAVKPDLVVGSTYNLDPDNEVGQTIADGVSRTFLETHADGSRHHELVIPLDVEGERAGAVLVQYYLEDAEAAVLRPLGTIALFGAVGVVLFMVASYFMARAIIDPLSQLSAAVRAFGAGDLSRRAKVAGVEETAQVARTFNEMADIMQDLDRQKDEFISIASHELKSPLATIKGYAQLLLRRRAKEPEKAADPDTIALEAIAGQADRMTMLIERLLDFSRVRMGRLHLEKEEFDLAEAIRDTVEKMQITTDRHVLRTFVEAPLLVKADPLRVEQVLTNLLSNAIKYSPGGYVDITSVKQEGQVQVSVRDQGPGIPKEKQAQLFQMFYRAHPTERGALTGMGLGLYLSRHLVEAHGGSIWVESEEGRGSTFYFTLPVQDP